MRTDMARPRSENPKGRRNVSMDGDVWRKGTKLAKEEQRSFSSLLSVLILREWERRKANRSQTQEAA